MSANYEITKADIKSLRVAFTRAETSTITSLDFSYSGEFLVITCKEILRIYELEEEKVRIALKITSVCREHSKQGKSLMFILSIL